MLSHFPKNGSLLIKVALFGEILQVKSLIENGTNINITDEVSKIIKN
jgi:hypothetical protein